MKRFKVIGILLLALFMSLTGCSAPVVNSPEAAEPAKTLRIGLMSDAGAIPFIIAEEQGFFEKKGIKVEIQVFKSAVDRDTALQTGNLDGAMADMLSAVFFKQAGENIKMTSQTYGNYKMVSSSKLNRADFIALDPVNIGISSNTVIDFATEQIAEMQHFSSRLQKVAIPQMPVRLEMLGAGELDGATLPEPLATIGLADGGVVIGSTEDMELYPGIFMMTAYALETQSDEIKAMYEAYNEAVDYVNATPSGTYYDLLVDKLGFPPQVKESFQVPTFSHFQDPDQQTFYIVAKWMKDRGLVDTLYGYMDLFEAPKK